MKPTASDGFTDDRQVWNEVLNWSRNSHELGPVWHQCRFNAAFECCRKYRLPALGTAEPSSVWFINDFKLFCPPLKNVPQVNGKKDSQGYICAPYFQNLCSSLCFCTYLCEVGDKWQNTHSTQTQHGAAQSGWVQVKCHSELSYGYVFNSHTK